MLNSAPASIAPCQTSVMPSLQDTQLAIKFWGVRGSIPTPVMANQRYGGNTVCIEVKLGSQRLIFDGGTGLVSLGDHLKQLNDPIEAHILFTHTQWDRIQGFPFFQPAFIPGNQFYIYGGTAPNGASIKHCLTDQMLKPHFSMPLQNMQAELSFCTLQPSSRFQIGEITVETFCTNPVTEALSYRLTWGGHSLVYATDTPTQCLDLDFLQFVDRADVLLYDGTYCDLTYLKTSVQENCPQAEKPAPWDLGLEIAQKAKVKELIFLHHSPLQDDLALDKLQQQLSDRLPQVKIAYEGLELAY